MQQADSWRSTCKVNTVYEIIGNNNILIDGFALLIIIIIIVH